MKQAALGKAWDQAVQAVIAEDAAILDDLKRQMEAGSVMPQIYTPLQVTNLFEKK